MVGIEGGYLWYEIGSESFLNAWFSTIHYHLEKEGWGSNYPVLMNDFYQGKVDLDKLSILREELEKVKKELKSLSVKDVIWDIRNLESKAPWGEDISTDITDLSNYFVTCNGEDLFDVLFIAIDRAKEDCEEIRINNL